MSIKNIVVFNENDNKKPTGQQRVWRSRIKHEIRKLKNQNKQTYKWIELYNQDLSDYEQSFDDEVLLYEELLEEIMYTKELLNISISKNAEKIENYIKLLNFKNFNN